MRDYLTYDVRRIREFSSGKMACATSTGPPKVVTLHAPFEVQTIGFVMSCYGDWPEIPSPDSLESKMVFLDGQQEFSQVMTDGANVIFQVMGAYFYVNTTPDGMSADIAVGVIPDTIVDPKAGLFKKTNLRKILADMGLTTNAAGQMVFQNAIIGVPPSPLS